MKKELLVRFYNIISKPVLLYTEVKLGFGTKMKTMNRGRPKETFLRPLVGVTRRDNIRQQPGVQKIIADIETYRRKWKNYISRMRSDRLQYKPRENPDRLHDP